MGLIEGISRERDRGNRSCRGKFSAGDRRKLIAQVRLDFPRVVKEPFPTLIEPRGDFLRSDLNCDFRLIPVINGRPAEASRARARADTRIVLTSIETVPNL